MSNFKPLSDKLARGAALTVVFLNDTGFIAGAGTAMRRQVQSLLAGGHNVAVVCWLENSNLDPRLSAAARSHGRWLGLHSLPSVHAEAGMEPVQIIERLVAEITSFAPDLVICGNLHWAKWPLSVMTALQEAGVPVVAYLHDCHWVTGRCAQPEGCTKYVTGCDATCPTSAQYPTLDPSRIREAWLYRRAVFTGPNPVPLAANSSWMRDLADRGFAGGADVAVLPLGLDHRLFARIERSLARRLLGLPEDAFLAVFGATDIANEAKGTAIYRKLGLKVVQRNNLKLFAFGHNSEYLEGVHGLGNIADERIMPVVYSAADVLISASRAESFGQTLLEAAACGLPLVAIAAGGVVDIAREGQNAIALPMGATDEQFLGALETLRADPDLCERMGRQGRRIVEDYFTLETQYQHWRDYLIRMPERRRTAKQLELS